MKRLLLVLVLTLPLAAQPDILKQVEKRYNSTDRMRAEFTQTYRFQGRTMGPVKGTVYLTKPGKMRWEYTNPAGDLFITDGKTVHQYDAEKKEYQRSPMKQTDDSRIPLSFLIGRLDFNKDWELFRSTPQGQDMLVTAVPKNKKLLFTEITMLIAPDASIRKVIVEGSNASTTEYLLANEQRNVPVPESLFKFTPPPGAKVVDLAN